MTKFHFTVTSQLVLEHDGRSKHSTHVETNIDLELSRNLIKDTYVKPDGVEWTAEGCKVITRTLCSALASNIHYAHQRGLKDSAEHMREIIDDLGEMFARADAKISQGKLRD
jgi:hypothetical protein